MTSPQGRLQASRTTAPGPIGPLARHELAMPPQGRVRRHERRELREYSSAEPGSQCRETPPLTVLEPQALPGQPSLQHTILLLQERDDADGRSSPPHGLVCPHCRQPVAVIENRLQRMILFICPACQHRRSAEEPGAPKE